VKLKRNCSRLSILFITDAIIHFTLKRSPNIHCTVYCPIFIYISTIQPDFFHKFFEQKRLVYKVNYLGVDVLRKTSKIIYECIFRPSTISLSTQVLLLCIGRHLYGSCTVRRILMLHNGEKIAFQRNKCKFEVSEKEQVR